MVTPAWLATITCFLIVLLTSPILSVAQHQPYAGQHIREIKALSTTDIESYLTGQGMGFAKAAELNHYPGPKHVLELAEVLQLTDHQRHQTRTIFDAMKQAAIQLGQQLVQAERHLDHLFADQTVTEETLQAATRAIADYRGQLRNVHLRAHLAQRRVLNDQQLRHYDHLRGYMNPAKSDHLHRHQH